MLRPDSDGGYTSRGDVCDISVLVSRRASTLGRWVRHTRNYTSSVNQNRTLPRSYIPEWVQSLMSGHNLVPSPRPCEGEGSSTETLRFIPRKLVPRRRPMLRHPNILNTKNSSPDHRSGGARSLEHPPRSSQMTTALALMTNAASKPVSDSFSSPSNCHPCLRAPVTLDSSLYTPRRVRSCGLNPRRPARTTVVFRNQPRLRHPE